MECDPPFLNRGEVVRDDCGWGAVVIVVCCFCLLFVVAVVGAVVAVVIMGIIFVN